MKKSILEKIIVITLTLGFLAGICLLEGMSFAELADNLTFLFLAIWAYILLDDFLAKVIWYRFALSKQYLVFEGLYIVSLIAFTGAFLANTFGWGVGCLVGAAVALVAAVVIHVRCYTDDGYTSFEIERAKWVIIRGKLKDMTREEVYDKVYSFLRYYPKRSLLESNLSLRNPVDTKGLNRTFSELMETEADVVYVNEVKEKLDKMIEDYLSLREPVKKGEEE